MARFIDPITKQAVEIGSPELNPELVQGKVPDTITPDTLSEVAPVTPAQPVETEIFPVGSLNAQVSEEKPLSGEQEQSDIIKRTQTLIDQLTSEGEFRAEKETEAGITDITKTQRDLSSRLKLLQAEAEAIPLQIEKEFEGRATLGGVAPIERGRLREVAIQSLAISAQLEATRGNLTTALDLVDRAVQQKFGPIEARINANLQNLELLSKDPTLTLAQKNRLERQKAIQEAEKSRLADLKKNEEAVQKIVVNAAATGKATSQQLEEIRNAGDEVRATELAAPFLVKPEKPDFQFVSGTANQPAGVFNKDTGVFTPFVPTPQGGSEVNVPEADFGSPEYRYNVVVGSSKFGDKQMTQGQLEQVQKALTALGGVESLNGLLFGGDVANSTGPIKGRVRNLINFFGADAPASQINATIQGLVPTIARGIFGEVGVLTDTDIANYSKTMANLKSTEEQNRLVSIVMLDVLSRTMENTLTTNALNQTNVSNFAPAMVNVRQRVDTEKLKLGVTPYSGLDNDSFLDSVPEEKTLTEAQEDFNQQVGNFLNFYFK